MNKRVLVEYRLCIVVSKSNEQLCLDADLDKIYKLLRFCEVEVIDVKSFNIADDVSTNDAFNSRI
jgi:hypothetical protein